MILKSLVDRDDVGGLSRCGREGSERQECKDRDKNDRLAAPPRYHDLTLPLSRDGQFTPEIYRKIPRDGSARVTIFWIFELIRRPTGHHWPGCLDCGSCSDCCAMASLGSSTVAMIRVFSTVIVRGYVPSQPRH